MKNLYFVTFHPTNTQFVVEQDNEMKNCKVLFTTYAKIK